jgi:large subunit ribosomal protein L3
MTIERNVKGLLGTKLGMTQTWDENNRVVPVTVVAAATNVVTQVRGPEKDGYNAVQIGFGEIEGRKVSKPKAVDSLMRLDLPADVNIEIKL